MQTKLFGYVHVHVQMHSCQVDLNVPRHIRYRFIVYTVHNFRDCNLNILACDPIKYKRTAFEKSRSSTSNRLKHCSNRVSVYFTKKRITKLCNS